MRSAVLSMLVASVAAAGAFWMRGSFGGILADLRGERYRCEPAVVRFGRITAGTTRTCAFRVENLSREPLTVLGAQESCGCMIADGFPMTIPAHDSREIVVDIAAGQEEAYFDQALTLYFDDPDRPACRVWFRGRVVANGGSTDDENTD